MPSGPQNFTLKEMKRAARALQEMGIKIEKVAVERGRVEFYTAEDSKLKTAGETSEDVKKLL
jgi:hypothetical protein